MGQKYVIFIEFCTLLSSLKESNSHQQYKFRIKVGNVHVVFFGLLLPDRPTKISHTEVPSGQPRSL